MAKATETAANTSVEYQVWYDSTDGVRRSMNALDEAGVNQIISDLNADESKRQLLAESVGIITQPHEHNITVSEITTSVKEVPL